MKSPSSDRSQANVNVKVRDALRGIRYALRKSGHFLNDQSGQMLPDPLNSLAHRAVRKLDRLSTEVERVTSSLGGPFQKSTSPDSTIFTNMGYRPNVPQTESDEAASALYFGLNYAFQSFHGNDVLISEALCLECILELEKAPDYIESATLACLLFKTVLEKRVFRHVASETTADDSALSNSMTTASFAVAMWFFLGRGIDSMDEQSLLDTCCEVTEYNKKDVVKLPAMPNKSEQLFRQLLDIIGDTGSAHPEQSSIAKLETTPISKSARRLRWFMKAFAEHTENVSQITGTEFTVDNTCLRRVFLKWVSRFEHQKPNTDPTEQFYITYPAAVMLQELIKNKPLSVESLPEHADTSKPAYFWPEAYVYVLLCVNVRSAVIEELLDVKTDKGVRFNNIDTWRSFKENCAENPATVIGFFQLFVGEEPSWESTNLFDAVNAKKNGEKILGKRIGQVESADS